MKFARFSMFTTVNRNLAITHVCDSISEARGWVVDRSFFSNIAATINFEMPSRSLQKFMDTLRDKGLKPRVEGDLPAADDYDLRGSVSLTFSHTEPDMKRDVPPFG